MSDEDGMVFIRWIHHIKGWVGWGGLEEHDLKRIDNLAYITTINYIHAMLAINRFFHIVFEIIYWKFIISDIAI